MAGYHAGDTLLQSKPFAFIISTSYRNLICEHCWRRLPGGCQLSCKSCSLVGYCGEECRLRGSEEHKRECIIMSRMGSAKFGLNDQLRLVLRIWLKIRSEGVHKVERVSNMSKCWDYLVDHAKELQAANKEELNAQYNELGAVMKKADMPSMETFINIYGKILVNSFSLRSDRTSTPEHFGTGVYLVASLLNHSCAPNCSVVFQGRQLTVVATKDIPEGSIPDVAFITYVNSLDDTVTRQQQLRDTWHFSCECTVCLNKKLDQQKHSMKCSNCSRDRPVDTVLWTLSGACPGCNISKENEDLKQLAKYKDLYLLLTVKGEVEFDRMCSWCVGQMEDVFSASDILYIQAAHHVHSIAMDQGQWIKATTSGEIALTGFKKYYGERAGLVAALFVRLGSAYSHEGVMDKCAECFHLAEDIYKVVPGEKSAFYRQDFRPVFDKYLEM